MQAVIKRLSALDKAEGTDAALSEASRLVAKPTPDEADLLGTMMFLGERDITLNDPRYGLIMGIIEKKLSGTCITAGKKS